MARELTTDVICRHLKSETVVPVIAQALQEAEERGYLKGLERSAVIADGLREVHSIAYDRADAAHNEDACNFIGGLRDGSCGVRDVIQEKIQALKAGKKVMG